MFTIISHPELFRLPVRDGLLSHRRRYMAYNSMLHGLIRNAGLTQKTFADALNLHPTQVSLIVTGDIDRIGWSKKKKKEKLTQIAKFFNKTLREIF